jgi:catechol 2,3-dioxygenase-like lactoylglutathione lyase family enzyme
MPTLHHVNLSVPETVDGAPGTDAEAAWLGLLGYRAVEPGPEIAAMTQVYWFEADDGTQVHLTPDADHAPSARAHTAVRVDDALDATIARIEATGQSCFTTSFDGDRHVFANDPAGNLWELIGPLPDHES